MTCVCLLQKGGRWNPNQDSEIEEIPIKIHFGGSGAQKALYGRRAEEKGSGIKGEAQLQFEKGHGMASARVTEPVKVTPTGEVT